MGAFLRNTSMLCSASGRESTVSTHSVPVVKWNRFFFKYLSLLLPSWSEQKSVPPVPSCHSTSLESTLYHSPIGNWLQKMCVCAPGHIISLHSVNHSVHASKSKNIVFKAVVVPNTLMLYGRSPSKPYTDAESSSSYCRVLLHDEHVKLSV